MNLRTLATLSVCVLSLSACDKLRGSAGADGGSSSTTSGGGITGLASKALSLVSPTGEAFEGAITMNNTRASKAADVIVYEVKGDKLRFDDPARHAYVIFNAADKKMITVDDTKKTAMVIDLDQMQKLAGSMGAGGPHPTAPTGPSDEDVSIDMSGGTDVVAGYTCDKWKITETNKKTSKVRKTDACLAKGIGFPDMSMGQAGATKSWMSKLVTDKFFPLRAVTTEDGVEQSRMEVTKIEKKTLDAARFEVPAGYTVTDMAQMMKGLEGMRPPQAPH
jgi:hypothetical protein